MAITDKVGETVGNMFGGVTKGVSTFTDIVPYIIAGIVVGVILWMLYEDIFLYKYKVHLKRIVGKSKVVFEDKALEKRLKNGARVWHFKRLKVDKAEPPEDVLLADGKGKIHAYGYIMKDNHIIWARDAFDLGEIEDKVIAALKKQEDKKETLTKDEEKLLEFNTNNQPVSTNDRIVAADCMEDSDFGKKSLNKLLEKILIWTPTIVIIVLLLFGFKYYAEPISELSVANANAVVQVVETSQKLAETNKETALLLAEIKGDYQAMKADLESLKDDVKAKPGVNASG